MPVAFMMMARLLSMTVISNTGTCGGNGNVVGDVNTISWAGPMAGTAVNLTFTAQNSSESVDFRGSLSGGVITGTMAFTHSLTSPNGNQSGSVTIPVTLR